MYRAKQNYSKKVPVAGRLQNVSGRTFAAVVLLAVMALLWGRVLLKGKNSPDTAAAQQLPQTEQAVVQPQEFLKLLPVKLNMVQGRHDVLKKDMFTTDRWDTFGLERGNEKETISENALEQRRQANLKKIAVEYKLEAIIQDADGNPYQVFVNDTILAVGSVLTVKEGPEQYELVLKGINENEATFTWNETSITLKMAETVEK